jgi:Arc/MetJ-type ribon-helix-helix transcriptional regulator
MATLTVEISNKMHAFIDQEIAAGAYTDASDLIGELLVLAMYDRDHEPDCYVKDGTVLFANDEQRESLENKLLESVSGYEPGEGIQWKQGDCVLSAEQMQELERRIESQRRSPQPGQTWDEVRREITR